MVIGAEMHQIGTWSKQALDRLAGDGLCATPQNYSLLYYYFSGGMAALSAAVEAALARGKLTQPVCDELYEKFVVADGQIAVLQDANDAIDREIKKVMAMLSVSARDAGQFGANLNEFSGQLGALPSLDALRGAVRKIADETHVIAAQNQKLQGELALTTDQLTETRGKLESVHKESQIDALTEVGNRKFFDREILLAINAARSNNTQLSLLMIDIDHFKKFNDAHGHLVGDQVLRLVARTMIENLKGRDVIARYGGEEFAILLPQTGVAGAARVADQLRVSLAGKNIQKRESHEILGVITISIGAAEHVSGEDKDQLISRADAALYQAKQTGRNRVVCAEIAT